jgi:hypothetical protein
MAEDATSEEFNLPNQTPKKWWQWLIVYPTVSIAILNMIVPALNSVINSWITGVTPNKSSEAIVQSSFFSRNPHCLESVKPVKISASQETLMQARVCPNTGDVYIVKAPFTTEETYRWIAIDELQRNEPQKNALTSILMQAAVAASSTGQGQLADRSQLAESSGLPTIVCTQVIEEGRLRRQVQYPDGHCITQIVNTYTGAVIESQSSSSRCNGNC